MTIYELTWGGSGKDRSVTGGPKYFGPGEHTDAEVRAAERLVELDRDDDLGCAWVSLKRLPDHFFPSGVQLIGWTKTSNERPTSEGADAPPVAA